VGNIANDFVLLIEPVVHFFLSIGAVLRKLSRSISSKPFNLSALPTEFCLKFFNKLTLHLTSLSFLCCDCSSNLIGIVSQIIQDLSLRSDARVSLLVKIFEIFVHLSADWIELIFQTLNAICTLFRTAVFQSLHTIISTRDFIRLILRFGLEAFVKIFVKRLELFLEASLVGFQIFINFLPFIHGILLDIFDFPKFEVTKGKRLTGRRL